MSSSLERRNNALRLNPSTVNGKTADITITTHGSDFYFAICAIMGITALTTIGLSYMKPRTHRIFFYITAALNFTACIAYFTMGSNLGFTPIGVEFPRDRSTVRGTNRSVFYARYVDWVITTPLLLMDLLLTAAMPWPTILWVIFLDEVMIITGLIGALVQSRYKWGFWTIGTIAMFAVFYELAITARKHAKALGSDVSRVFTTCGCLTLVIWLLYPIAWGVSEGGNVIAPDSEAVFYGILDFLAKPVFSAALIYGHWNIDPARLGLQIREFGAPYLNGGDKERDGHELNATRQHTDQEAHTGPAIGTTSAQVPSGGVVSHRHETTSHDFAGEHAPVYDVATGQAPVRDVRFP